MLALSMVLSFALPAGGALADELYVEAPIVVVEPVVETVVEPAPVLVPVAEAAIEIIAAAEVVPADDPNGTPPPPVDPCNVCEAECVCDDYQPELCEECEEAKADCACEQIPDDVVVNLPNRIRLDFRIYIGPSSQAFDTTGLSAQVSNGSDGRMVNHVVGTVTNGAVTDPLALLAHEGLLNTLNRTNWDGFVLEPGATPTMFRNTFAYEVMSNGNYGHVARIYFWIDGSPGSVLPPDNGNGDENGNGNGNGESGDPYIPQETPGGGNGTEGGDPGTGNEPPAGDPMGGLPGGGDPVLPQETPGDDAAADDATADDDEDAVAGTPVTGPATGDIVNVFGQMAAAAAITAALAGFALVRDRAKAVKTRA